MKSDAIINAVQGVTAKWAKQRRREEREASASMNRHRAMTGFARRVTISDAASEVMEDAYMKASAGGTLPAHARQIMYAARGHIQRTADRPIGNSFDKYFTQTLLPEYIEAHNVDWNVVFDARGHLTEPHIKRTVPLGTLQVRRYLDDVGGHVVEEPSFNIGVTRYPTVGPNHRFGAILFIEKEGFLPLFDAVKLAERYDIAIMSTKGMSVIASRELVQSICGTHKIPLLVLHDFDISGFSIFGTLRTSTWRFQYSRKFDVVDLGLRLADIEGLETEDVFIKPDTAWKKRATLKRHGATEAEIAFLMRRRVELNALPSDRLIAWIESKLDQHGVAKIVPDDATLADAYARMRRQASVQAKIDEVVDTLDDTSCSAPDGLRDHIASKVKAERHRSWDEVLRDVARADHWAAS